MIDDSVGVSHLVAEGRATEEYGGRLTVQSTLGEGRTFTVHLPQGEAHTPPGEPESDAQTAHAPPTQAPPKPRLKVLVIDDEPAILLLARDALSEFHEVTMASNVEEAAELEHLGAFDVVVCDLVMPGLGSEGLYRLAKERHPQLVDKLLVMTAGAFTDDARAAMTRRDRPVLQKPFRLGQLIDAVEASGSSRNSI